MAPKESKVRNSNHLGLGLCSAVAAVAVAGSAGAGFTTAIDPFTTAQIGSIDPVAGPAADPFADPAIPPVGGLFDSRGLTSGVSVIAGTTKLQFDNNYRGDWISWFNANGTGVDLTAGRPDGFQITFNFDLTGTNPPNWYDNGSTTSIFIDLLSRGQTVSRYETFFVNGAGTATLTVLSSEYSGPVNYQNITNISMFLDDGTTGWISDFNITAVPAPGAAALIGAAGLITVRRRKA